MPYLSRSAAAVATQSGHTWGAGGALLLATSLDTPRSRRAARARFFSWPDRRRPARRVPPVSPHTPHAAQNPSLGRRRRRFKANKELQQRDRRVPQLGERKAALEEKLAAHGRDLSQLSLELAELIATIEAAEERWLELSELQA